MAVDLEKLIVEIEARTTQYERALKKIEGNTGRSTRRMARGFKNVDSAMARLAKSARTFTAIAFGGIGARQIGQVFGDVSNIQDVAEKVGLTTDQLQEMRFAAEQTGVAINAVDMGMQRFSRRVAEAANGSGELLPILKANNVALRNTDGSMRSQNDILRDYADLIRNAGSEQEQLLLAFKAFDSEGAALVNLFRDGADGLNDFATQAQTASAVIDKELIASAKAIDDDFKSLTRTIGAQLKSAIVSAADQLVRLYRIARDSPSGIGILAALNNPLDAGTVRPTSAPDPTRRTVIPDPESARVETERQRELLRLQKEAERAAERAKQRREGVIQQLMFEAEQLGRTAEMQRLYNELQAAGVTLESDAGQRIESLVGQNIMLEKLRDAQDAYNDSLRTLADLGVDTFDRMISGGEKLTDVLRDMAKQLASSATRALLLGQGPLAGLFGTSGGSGGLLSSLIPRSGGGSVSPNNAFKVGERGPELFVPSSAGKIIPNHQLRGGGGGTNIQIINQSNATVEPAGQGRDAQGNPYQRLIVRDAVQSEIPDGLRKFGSGFNLQPALAKR